MLHVAYDPRCVAPTTGYSPSASKAGARAPGLARCWPAHPAPTPPHRPPPQTCTSPTTLTMPGA